MNTDKSINRFYFYTVLANRLKLENTHKIIIMYRTAIMAQDKRNSTKSFALKATCDELIENFNKGEHIIDESNDKNSYSILYVC